MVSRVVTDHDMHLAFLFVNALFTIFSVYYAAFALRNTVRVPVLKYDPSKHAILSFRAGIAIVLTAVTFGEFVYQLACAIYPDESKTLFYADQVLTFLSWASNVWMTILFAKNGAWVYFKAIDHFLAILSWIFLFAIEALRFDQFVMVRVASSTEQLTSTLILTLSLVYFGTLVAFLMVDGLRKWGICLNKYQQLEGEDTEQNAGGSINTISAVVEERTHVVLVHPNPETGLP